MRLDDEAESANVENRRGAGGGLGGLGGNLLVRGGHLSFGGVVLLIIFAVLFRINPLEVLNGRNPVLPDQTTSQSAGGQAAESDTDIFVSKILHSTETVWTKEFSSGALHYYDPTAGSYVEPKLVLFADSIDTACGGATAAVGPFYCPGDAKVYLDTSFFNELQQRFGAPGEAARAYVIAQDRKSVV